MVHDVEGQHPDSLYSDDAHVEVFAEIGQVFGLQANIYFAFIDNSRGSRPRGGRAGKTGGTASTSGGDWETVAHELGHAFGLEHDFRNSAYLMAYGEHDRLSACAAEFLSAHPFFNPEIPTAWGEPPSVELLSAPEYPKGASRFSLEFKVADPEGVHQLIVSLTSGDLSWAAGYPEVRACRGLDGLTEGTVEIEFDDPTPSYFVRGARKIHVRVVGSDGDFRNETYGFVETSEYKIATLQGPTQPGHVRQVAWTTAGVYRVEDVVFSPDGSTLVAASTTMGLKLWDVESRSPVDSLGGIRSCVAFSPDGSLRATGEGSGMAVVHDLEADRSTILHGHNDFITAVAFSADGALLAVGARDGTLKVWDVGTLWDLGPTPAVASMEGHTKALGYLSFTADGTLLASLEQRGGPVRLWDVATGAPSATAGLPEGQRFSAVALAPDTTILALTSHDDGRVRLWDVVSGVPATIVSGARCREAADLTFSPDGQILACASSADNTIQMWDLFTEEEIASLGAGLVHSVAFSPDGRLLAAGVDDGTVTLWDVTEWTGLRPRALVKISGDNQQGALGAELADPYIVEVWDQNGDPLPGARVVFRVISGGGEISGRYTVKEVTTGQDGRAEANLTLGSEPGANTVKVLLGGRERLTFHALGVGTPEVAMADFDYPRMDLPAGATVRLGRGSIGSSDRALSFSPDGLLAVASAAGAWLYEAEDPERLFWLPIEKAQSVAFSPNGVTLALAVAAWDEGSLTLWDLETRTQISTLMDAWPVRYVAFSPNGSRVVFGGWVPELQLWDAETDRTATLEGHTSPGTSAAFSPDRTVLASGEEDGTVRLWNPETGVNTAVLEGHRHIVNSVAFSSDGAILASASASGDGSVGLWDVATEARTGTLLGHDAHVLSVAFAPGSDLLASGGFDGSLMLWNATTQRNVAVLSGHTGKVWSVAFSPDASVLASASQDGSIRLWDLTTGHARIVSGHTDFITEVAWSPDGNQLVTVTNSWTGRAHLWDVTTGRELASFSGQGRRFGAFAFSPNGQTLATGTADGGIVIWDLAAYVQDRVFAQEHSGALSFSPDGQTLAASSDKEVYLWDMAAGQEIDRLTGFEDWITSLSFSPDGQTLACGSYSGELKAWNLATGEVATLEGHLGHIGSLSFGRDGARLTSISEEVLISGNRATSLNRIIQWNLDTGEAVSTRTMDWIGAMDLSPDGRTFASGRYDGLMQLWNLEDGRALATVQGPDFEVLRVLFSPDGSHFASVARGGVVTVWDVEQLRPHPQVLAGLSGDGQEAAPGSQLTEPLVVEVRDQHGEVYPGAVITFSLAGGSGTLSTLSDTTDADGRAAAILTLGEEPGTYTVVATVADLEPVTFTATAQATPDFDGDGEIGFGDFFLFAEALRRQRPPLRSGRQRHRRLHRLLPLRRALRPAGAGQADGSGPGADRPAREPRPAAECPQPLQQPDRDLLVAVGAGPGPPGGVRPDRAAGGGAARGAGTGRPAPYAVGRPRREGTPACQRHLRVPAGDG